MILDLEDKVPSEKKFETREAVSAWLSPERPAYVRVNGTATPWFWDDLEAVARGFMPSEAEALWARRVLEAAGAAEKEAVRFEGEMIDRPIIERAGEYSPGSPTRVDRYWPVATGT